MAEAGPVPRIRILVGTGRRLDRTSPRNEQEVPEVRDARTAQVRQAEPHDRGLRVLVARRDIIVVIVGVRADLDAAERHLRPGIHVPETGGADKRIDVAQMLFRGQADGQAGQQDCQKQGFSVHKKAVQPIFAARSRIRSMCCGMLMCCGHLRRQTLQPIHASARMASSCALYCARNSLRFSVTDLPVSEDRSASLALLKILKFPGMSTPAGQGMQ